MDRRGMTMAGLLAAAMVATGALDAAFAQEGEVMALPDSELGKYAAFAKLESNLAEITAGTLLGKMMTGADAAAAMDLDDPADDITAAEGYVGVLEGMDLTDAERSALDSFKAGWGELMALRTAIAEAEELEPEALAAYWEKANGLDEMVDDILQSIIAEAPGMN